MNKRAKMLDDIHAIEDKIYDVRRGAGDRKNIPTWERDIDSKKTEYNTFVKVKKFQIAKGMDLLDKTISRNARRREYYDAGLIDDKVELAKFEYDLAKSRSYEDSEIDKIKDKLDKAVLKNKEFSDELAKNKNKSVTVDETKLTAFAALKKKISEKDSEIILTLKDKTGENIDKLKKSLSDELTEILKKVSIAKSAGKKYAQPKLKKDLSVLYSIANEIDSLDNLYDVYSKIGKSKKSISKKLVNSSGIGAIFSDIKDAITKGKDTDSGISMEILDFQNNPTESKIKTIIKKLS